MMNKKAKKVASVVLGTALMGATIVGCAGSKSSCSNMGSKSSCSNMEKKTMKKASCGSSGCGSSSSQ